MVESIESNTKLEMTAGLGTSATTVKFHKTKNKVTRR